MMQIHRSTKPLERFYTLNKHVLVQVDQPKYLRVMIAETLYWSPHINNIVIKAINGLASSKEILAIAHTNSESWPIYPLCIQN